MSTITLILMYLIGIVFCLLVIHSVREDYKKQFNREISTLLEVICSVIWPVMLLLFAINIGHKVMSKLSS